MTDVVKVPVDQLFTTLKKFRDQPELSFDRLADVTAVDRGDTFTLVYHLHSLIHASEAIIQADVGRQEPVVDSVSCLWGSALFGEREVADMFGIRFEGHPDLRPLLAPEEGFAFFPLRKDFNLGGR